VSLREHVVTRLVAVVLAAFFAIPVGLVLAIPVVVASPSLASPMPFAPVPAFGLMILLYVLVSPRSPSAWDRVAGATGALGSFIPIEAMLVVLAIPPILVNTYAGVQAVDPAARDAARGMGMTGPAGGHLRRTASGPAAGAGWCTQCRAPSDRYRHHRRLLALSRRIGLSNFHQWAATDQQHESRVPGHARSSVIVALLAVVAELLLLGVEKLIVSPGLTGSFRLKRRSRTLRQAQAGVPDGYSPQIQGET